MLKKYKENKYSKITNVTKLFIGMVYMSSSILNWNPILTAWLKKRPSIMTEVLMPAFEGSFCGKNYLFTVLTNNLLESQS